MNSRLRFLTLLLVLIASAAYYYQYHFSGTQAEIKTAKTSAKKPLKLDANIKSEIEAYIQDLEIPPHENNIKFAIKLDHGTGRKELAKGNNKKAFEIYRKILAISYNNNSLMGIGLALGVLSGQVSGMNNEEEALKLAMLSYKVGKAMNNRLEYGVAELALANRVQNKDRTTAIKWRLKAKESLKGTPYKQDYISLLNTLASDIEWLGNKQQALATIDEAWRLVSGYGNALAIKNVRAEVAYKYAGMLQLRGQYQEALDLLKTNLQDFTADRKESVYYAQLLYKLGELHVALGQIDQAKHFYTTAYSHYENNRSKALGDNARALVDNNNTYLVNRLIDTFIQEQDYYSALAILETNKARTLNDISEDVNQKNIYQQLTALKRKHAQQRVVLMEQMQSSNANDEESDLRLDLGFDDDDYSQRWRDYKALFKKQQKETQALSINLQLRDVAVSKAMDADQIKSLQRQIGKNEAMIALFASDKNLQVFVMTRDQLGHFPSEMTYAEYWRETEKLRAAILNPHIDFYKAPARKLAAAIIKPIIEHLGKDVTTIIYSPDGMFARIPLAVMPLDDQFIAERYQIVRVPSLGFYQHRSQSENVTHGVSCVDPEIYGARLPFQQETGNKLVSLYQNNLKYFTGPDCTTANLEQAISEIQQPSFLHIGAHGNFYPQDAMQSGIYLASDKGGEAWQAHSIASNNLTNFDLITLSSCETGLTNLKNKRDVFGIIRALKFGGANQVIAPLWAVQDQATGTLMQSFYQSYAKGFKAYEALHRAQNTLIKHDDYSHPFYWAGFVLTGGTI